MASPAPLPARGGGARASPGGQQVNAEMVLTAYAGDSEGFRVGSSLVPEEWLERDGRRSGVHLTTGHRHLAHR